MLVADDHTFKTVPNAALANTIFAASRYGIDTHLFFGTSVCGALELLEFSLAEGSIRYLRVTSLMFHMLY